MICWGNFDHFSYHLSSISTCFPSIYKLYSPGRTSSFSSLVHRTAAAALMDPSPPQPAEHRHNHTPSSSSSSQLQGVPNMGKHRMSAAISFLNQQIQLIQDELDELETIGGVSTVCPDLVRSVDSVPDALLPVTIGPAEISWDRWFQGAHSSGNRRRWI